MGENICKQSDWQGINIQNIQNSSCSSISKKTNNPIKKWAEELNRHFSKEDIQIDSQKAHEKVLNIANYQRNASQNYNEVSPHCDTSNQVSLVRMAIIKKSTNNKCWREYGENGTLLHCWWECKLVQPLWSTVWRFLKELKIELPYNPAIPFFFF